LVADSKDAKFIEDLIFVSFLIPEGSEMDEVDELQRDEEGEDRELSIGNGVAEHNCDGQDQSSHHKEEVELKVNPCICLQLC